MGIVAFCPNGHRIKVKDELAGRKGICPTCTARFRIPRHGTRPGFDARDAAASAPPVARIVSVDPVVAASLPAALAAAPDGHDDAAMPEAVAVDCVPEFIPLDDAPEAEVPPPPVAPPAVPLGAHAALDERPDLAWCVAVRGGPPSAPLHTDAMRAWLAVGAASADHVVWRQDWPEWRPLFEVFPEARPPRGPALP